MVWPEVGTGDWSGRRSPSRAVLALALPPVEVILVGSLLGSKMGDASVKAELNLAFVLTGKLAYVF